MIGEADEKWEAGGKLPDRLYAAMLRCGPEDNGSGT